MRWSVLALAACGATPHPHAGAPRVLSYSAITVGRPAGGGEVQIAADGSRREHYTYNDRGRGPDLTTTIAFDAAGTPVAMHTTGHDYLKAPVDEALALDHGQLVWSSNGEHGSAAAGTGWYDAQQAPLDAAGLLARALLRAPGHRVKLLPQGEVWLEDEQRIDVDVAGTPRRLHRVAIAGQGFQPGLVWLDEDDEYFGEVSAWTSFIRAGAEPAIPAMVKLDEQWRAAHAERLAHQLAHRPPPAGLAFVHANLFDSEHARVIRDATVVVTGDAITAVGDASTPVPAGARVIDASGMTLLPGLWDMHVHLDAGDGVLDLANGITSVRDLGNDIDALAGHIARFEAGTELGPRVVRAGLIDGPGPFAAPTGTLVDTAEAAIAAVQHYADLGYAQIKIYSSVNPQLVPVIAKAAHARGLRLSGHIPNGMNAAEAVEAGYDEIQHVNFLFLRFLAKPSDDTRTPVRFTAVARGAAGLDLDGTDVQQFLELLVAHHTVLDPTLSAFEDMFTADPGELDPVLAPYAAQLPPQITRHARGGGLPAPDGQRATFRASYAALGKLIKRAWDRHIPIVAGTDSYAGMTLSRELEHYVEIGIPAPDVLALATLGAARVMHLDHDRGSITAGKRADLVLVAGDPTRDIAAVRDARVVVCRGIAYDPGELYAAVGMRPRP